MTTARKTQIEKIEAVLRRYKGGKGVTAKSIARMARVPYEAVGKRVYDLRETYNIVSNFQTVDGKRTAFYRMG